MHKITPKNLIILQNKTKLCEICIAKNQEEEYIWLTGNEFDSMLKVMHEWARDILRATSFCLCFTFFFSFICYNFKLKITEDNRQM